MPPPITHQRRKEPDPRGQRAAHRFGRHGGPRRAESRPKAIHRPASPASTPNTRLQGRRRHPGRHENPPDGGRDHQPGPPGLQDGPIHRPLAVMRGNRTDRGHDYRRQRGCDADLHHLAAAIAKGREGVEEGRHQQRFPPPTPRSPPITPAKPPITIQGTAASAAGGKVGHRGVSCSQPCLARGCGGNQRGKVTLPSRSGWAYPGQGACHDFGSPRRPGWLRWTALDASRGPRAGHGTGPACAG